MRTVAAYSLTRPAPGLAQAPGDLVTYCRMVEEWLGSKGAGDVTVGEHEITFPDGRIGRLTRGHMETDAGILDSFVLNEPIPGGRFETRLDLACGNGELVLFCQLATGSAESPLAPVYFDARCPGVLRDITRSGGWTSGSSEVSDRHLTCIGREAARELALTIWDDERGLPVVVVSEHEGFTLHPDLAADLAHDLTGLATVVQIDEEASWLLSEEKGREWSCYQGALRLYWPFRTARNDPYSHPLWTQARLLHGGVDTTSAAKHVQNRLRRTILSPSAFQATPPIVTRVRDMYVSVQRGRAQDAGDYEDLWHDSDQENLRLKRENEGLKDTIDLLREEIEDLEAQNSQLSISRDWRQSPPSVVEEERDTPPSTVEQAVSRARDDCEHLTWGEDVDDGIDGLARDAGPPLKIYQYLRDLNSVTAKLAEGRLRTGMHQLLRDMNVKVSGESETIRRSPAEMAKRTWDDGSGARREFEDHLKPKDSTSPDRCVRIYFGYDKELGKTIVGWVGRHPD